MKKLFAIMLTLAMLAGCCACGNKEAAPAVQEKIEAPEGALTLDSLNNLKTKEDMAALLGIKNPEELEQMLTYIENYYYHLPSQGDPDSLDTSWGKTDEGYNSLTAAQAKSLITPTVVTTENWKDFFEGRNETIPCYDWDEDGNETVTYEDYAYIGMKTGTYGSDAFTLVLVDNETGEQLTAGSRMPFEVDYVDGEYLIIDYDNSTWDENDELIKAYKDYNPDNYTCIYADGVVYSYELAPELRYTYEWDDDKCEEVYTAVSENADFDEDYAGSSTVCFIQLDEDGSQDDSTIVGYQSLGSYLYTDDEFKDLTGTDTSVIDINPVNELTLQTLQQFKTKEELAAALGVFMPSEMPQMLVYLHNFYYHLPSQGDPTEPVTSWSTTDEGYNSLTIEQAKTLVAPAVVTEENWMNYIAPYMETVIYSEYDEDGNETSTEEKDPAIGIDTDKYDYSWDVCHLIFINNTTGMTAEYDGLGGWSESVSLEDGKFCVTAFNEKGFGGTEEFNPDNYTCVYADCVVYTYDLAPELLYVEYYDDAVEDWVVVQADEYDGTEYDPMVFVQYGENDYDIMRCSLSGLGTYVFNPDYR